VLQNFVIEHELYTGKFVALHVYRVLLTVADKLVSDVALRLWFSVRSQHKYKG